MVKPDLVIFDCDGVLVDSEIIAARVDVELLAEAGVEMTTEEFISRYAGLTFTETVLRVEAEYNIPLQASLIERSAAILDRRLAAEVRAIDGAHEAVAATADPKCICSNSTPQRLEFMLTRAGLRTLFEHVFSARAIASHKPKPAPDIFLHAAEQLGADPARTMVIEDSVHGITGARRAGMRVIGFTGGSHSWPGHGEALSDAGAETVINRWADLQQVLSVLSQWRET